MDREEFDARLEEVLQLHLVRTRNTGDPMSGLVVVRALDLQRRMYGIGT
jgi:hypothetical protein